MPICCVRFKKRATDDQANGVSPTSDIKRKQTKKKLIDQLADDIFDLSLKRIGGTVVINHLGEKTSDWHEAMQMFISKQPFGKPYRPGALEKIFGSKGREGDRAAIFYLSDGFIDSVGTVIPITDHICKQCANRGTRHMSACSFSSFTSVPIVVISEQTGQVSLFWKGRSHVILDQENLKKKLLKAYATHETLSSIHEHWSSMGLLRSGTINPYDEILFVKNLIDLLADDFYDLARKNIGGTVILNYHCDVTGTKYNWRKAMETFIAHRPFDQPYKPGVFEKIFTSKSQEHDGAVIFYLCYGLIDSVSAVLSMMKNNCDSKCLDRETRHNSACYFSKSTSIPIVVISEEDGQISVFWKGRSFHGIGKKKFKKELFNGYLTEKKSSFRGR